VHFSERIEVPVAPGEVWSFVWQVERTATCLPGCVRVTEVEPDRRYTARIEDHRRSASSPLSGRQGRS